jgi:hypothetical protein
MMDEPDPPNGPDGSTEDLEIIPEVWLQALLAISGDKERRADLIQKVSEHTGFPPEKVELIMSALLSTLSNMSRSN